MSNQSSESIDSDAHIIVVDYGLGNLRSVQQGLLRAGASVDISSDPDTFASADGIVLPGVGAFREGVENAGPYRDTLIELADSGMPLFGICLGMQMLLTDSEEASHEGQGDAQGLDLIPGNNIRFSDNQTVPHMGWNQLSVTRSHPLTEGIDGRYAYFVHSYYAEPHDSDAVVAETVYGAKFPSIIANEAGNVFGTQFHPEKSGETGLRILQNFVSYCAD